MPADAKELQHEASWAGFKLGVNGPHSSRTLMLEEISRCLDGLPPAAQREEYRAAIVERNLLAKSTESTRKESFRRLRELYGLDPSLPIFSIYRRLDTLDPASRPLLSVLIACARDPLLRATIPRIASTKEGQALGAADFDEVLEATFPGHMKPKIRAATARHIAATWTHSGHLAGHTGKQRIVVSARPAALTLALILGTLQGQHAEALLGTTWCLLLDLNAAQARALANQAHREGFLDMRAIGSIVEFSFPRFADDLSREKAP